MNSNLAYRLILNRMGYYDYQNSLIFRHLNQDGLWESHLQNCREFILRSLDFYKPDTVTVLGSGWLLDLPLAEIIEKTSKVRLVDIVHPPAVREQTAAFTSVELVEDDVTGGVIREVWEKCRNHFFFNRLRTLENIIISEYHPDFDPGMVISLNIMTQLESMLLRHLKKHAIIKDDELLKFRAKIQEGHISFLVKHQSVLITDIDEVVTDKSGRISSIPGLLTSLPDVTQSEEWIWNFDLTGTDYNNRRSVMKMKAVII